MPNGTRRTALITGAGRNIGRDIALGLAEDGFNIVLNTCRSIRWRWNRAE